MKWLQFYAKYFFVLQKCEKNEFYDDRQTIQQDWYFNPEKNELWGSDWMIFIIIYSEL